MRRQLRIENVIEVAENRVDTAAGLRAVRQENPDPKIRALGITEIAAVIIRSARDMGVGVESREEI
jgi:type III secretion system FlhB-like substrate exporter